MRIFIHNVDTFLGKALVQELSKDERGLNRIFGSALHGGSRAVPPAAVKRLFSRDDPKKAQKMREKIQSCRLVILDLFSCTLEDLHFVITALKVNPKSVPPKRTGELEQDVTFVLLSSVMVWAATEPPEPPPPPPPAEGEAPSPDDPDAPEAVADSASELAARPPTRESGGASPEPPGTAASPVADGEGAGLEGAEGSEGRAASPEEEQRAATPPPPPPVNIKDEHYQRRAPLLGSKYEQWKEMEDLVMGCFNQEGSQVKGFVVAAGVLYGDGEATFCRLFKDAWLGAKIPPIMGPGSNQIPTIHVRDLGRVVRQIAYKAELSVEERPYFLAVDEAPSPSQSELVRGIVGELSGASQEVPVIEEEEPKEAAEAGEPVAGQEAASGCALEEQQMEQQLNEALKLNLSMEPSTLMLAEDFAAESEPPGWHCRGGLLKNICKVAEEFVKVRQLRALRIIISGPPVSGKTTLAQAVAAHFNIPHLELQPAQLEEMSVQLNSEVCRYRGYVLDAGPAGFSEIEALFRYDFELPPGEDEDEDEDQAAADADPGGSPRDEEPAPKKRIERRLNKDLCPTFAMLLQAPDGLCRARSAARGGSTTDEFAAKMEAYRLGLEGESSFASFFQDVADVGVFNMPIAGRDAEDIFESARIYIESAGRPFNYLKTEEEVAAELLAQQVEEEEREEEARGMEIQRQASVKGDGPAEMARRMERMRIISQHEAERRKLESLTQREYLMRYMVPTLTEGLIELCKVLPEDPVDYLATYLEQHAADEKEGAAAVVAQ